MIQVRERAHDLIVELSTRGHDLVTFWREATDVLRPVIPHHMSPCWFTLDPASLLITSHFQEQIAEFPREMLAAEFDDSDAYTMFDVVRSQRGWNTLHDATNGNPSQSARWQQNMAMGGDQEFIVALRSKTEIWGALGLYRESGRPRFDRDDIELVLAVAPPLAAGARNGLAGAGRVAAGEADTRLRTPWISSEGRFDPPTSRRRRTSRTRPGRSRDRGRHLERDRGRSASHTHRRQQPTLQAVFDFASA